MTKKTIGFYFSACACVLALVACILYGNVSLVNGAVRPLLIASVALSVLCLGLTLARGALPGGNLLPLVNAVLLMAAIGLSVGPMVTTVAFALMGMNPMSAAQPYLTFAVVALIGWCLSVIAAFIGIAKKTA